jgi:hypothetical protein
MTLNDVVGWFLVVAGAIYGYLLWTLPRRRGLESMNRMSRPRIWLRHVFLNTCPECGDRRWAVYSWSCNICLGCRHVGD